MDERNRRTSKSTVVRAIKPKWNVLLKVCDDNNLNV